MGSAGVRCNYRVRLGGIFIPSRFWGSVPNNTEQYESGTAQSSGTASAHGGGIPRGTFGTGSFKIVRGSGYPDDPYVGIYAALLTLPGTAYTDIYLPVQGSPETIGRIRSWGVHAITQTTPTEYSLVMPICYNATPDTGDLNLGRLVCSGGTVGTPPNSLADWTLCESSWHSFGPDNRIGDWYASATTKLPLVQLYYLGNTAADTTMVVIEFEWFDKVR